LISIADACGAEVGTQARAIAVERCSGLDEDFAVVLLTDIRDIFDERRQDKLPSDIIVNDLIARPHGRWAEWRGLDDLAVPRKLTWGIMAIMLRPFGIRPRTVRLGLAPKDTARGYHRNQFEDAWARYCPPQPNTPAHPRARVGVLASSPEAERSPQFRAVMDAIKGKPKTKPARKSARKSAGKKKR